MNETGPRAAGGRAASMARRAALASGKSALPPAAERVRSGFRAATLPGAPQPAPAAPSAAPSALRALAADVPPAMVGRALSMQRRRALSAGKQALGVGVQNAAARVAPAPDAAAAPPLAETAERPAAPRADDCCMPCREQARMRRALQSRVGKGDPGPARPSRPPRRGELAYAPKVVASATVGGQQVTGVRIGSATTVTGIEAGREKAVTGTQYLAADDAPARAGGPKVGLHRTAGGLTVSGTLVRSRVRVTGDDAGAGVTVTGEVDPRPEDDLTPRAAPMPSRATQFARQANPHGHSVFGTHLGGSMRALDARERSAPVERTEGGQPVTGSAVGRSARVTGDEDGACRRITGDQYATPASASAECGASGGGTAPAAQLGATRRDPVTGAKVTESLTWRGQRVTGPAIEVSPRVTGDEPGTCATVTGTPYFGPTSAFGWCAPEAAEAVERRVASVTSAAPDVTGDVPRESARVTGSERGAARAISGTPYWTQAAPRPVESVDPLERIAAGFSVKPPQRLAQLAAEREAAAAAPGEAPRVTGSFAAGGGKVTGNLEFRFRPREAAEAKRPRITGEGRTEGPRVSGDAWAENPRVTGTEGHVAIERNPSERGGERRAWAGAGRFKGQGRHEEPRQIVTGMVGWTAKSAAKVTLSGGAQG